MLTLGVLLVSSIACEAEKSRNPLSPSIAGPIAGIALSAPTILSPTNGTLIQFAQQPIELEFNRSVSNGERPFWYEVDVATDRMLTLGVLLVSSIACEAEKSRNPLSPSIAGPIAGIALSAPTILSPTNGTLIQFAQQPIELEFNRSVSNGERPFWYEVDVATDREFSTLTHSVPNIEPNRQITEGYTLNVELNANQVYFWRVRALDGANTGNYSEPAAFEIYTPLQTSKPTIVSPNDGARVSANTVTLVVENASIAGAANAVHYQFQVATDVGFQTITQSNTVSEGTTTTSTLTDSLEDDTVYFWRSRVICLLYTSPSPRD